MFIYKRKWDRGMKKISSSYGSFLRKEEINFGLFIHGRSSLREKGKPSM